VLLLVLVLLLAFFPTEALFGAFVCFVLSKLVRSALTAATGFNFGLDDGSCLLAAVVGGLEVGLRFTAYGLTALETVIVDDDDVMLWQVIGFFIAFQSRFECDYLSFFGREAKNIVLAISEREHTGRQYVDQAIGTYVTSQPEPTLTNIRAT
jgi:hypothetical protein